MKSEKTMANNKWKAVPSSFLQENHVMNERVERKNEESFDEKDEGGSVISDSTTLSSADFQRTKHEKAETLNKNKDERLFFAETYSKGGGVPVNCWCPEEVFAGRRRRILVLGDGNLTFSASLAEMLNKNPDDEHHVIATVLENRDDYLAKYNAPDDLELLQRIELGQKFPNLELVFGVDATALDVQTQWPLGTFTDIVMNFPHLGNKTNLKDLRTLLRKIFQSLAASQMAVEQTRFHLTLAKGQTGVDHALVELGTSLSMKPPELKLDSWQPLQIAARHGLRVETIRSFRTEIFQGYRRSGYKERGDKGFHCEEGSQTITFVLICPISLTTGFLSKIELKTVKALELYWGRFSSFAEPFSGHVPDLFCAYHNFRPFYEYDLSILFGARWTLCSEEEGLDKAEKGLIQLIYNIAGPIVVDVFERSEKRSVHDGKSNRIYCIRWQGWYMSLCRDFANHLQDQLCKVLATEFALNIGSELTLSGYMIFDEESLTKEFFQEKTYNIAEKFAAQNKRKWERICSQTHMKSEKYKYSYNYPDNRGNFYRSSGGMHSRDIAASYATSDVNTGKFGGGHHHRDGFEQQKSQQENDENKSAYGKHRTMKSEWERGDSYQQALRLRVMQQRKERENDDAEQAEAAQKNDENLIASEKTSSAPPDSSEENRVDERSDETEVDCVFDDGTDKGDEDKTDAKKSSIFPRDFSFPPYPGSKINFVGPTVCAENVSSEKAKPVAQNVKTGDGGGARRNDRGVESEVDCVFYDSPDENCRNKRLPCYKGLPEQGASMFPPGFSFPPYPGNKKKIEEAKISVQQAQKDQQQEQMAVVEGNVASNKNDLSLSGGFGTRQRRGKSKDVGATPQQSTVGNQLQSTGDQAFVRFKQTGYRIWNYGPRLQTQKAVSDTFQKRDFEQKTEKDSNGNEWGWGEANSTAVNSWPESSNQKSGVDEWPETPVVSW